MHVHIHASSCTLIWRIKALVESTPPKPHDFLPIPEAAALPLAPLTVFGESPGSRAGELAGCTSVSAPASQSLYHPQVSKHPLQNWPDHCPRSLSRLSEIIPEPSFLTRVGGSGLLHKEKLAFLSPPHIGAPKGVRSAPLCSREVVPGTPEVWG